MFATFLIGGNPAWPDEDWATILFGSLWVLWAQCSHVMKKINRFVSLHLVIWKYLLTIIFLVYIKCHIFVVCSFAFGNFWRSRFKFENEQHSHSECLEADSRALLDSLADVPCLSFFLGKQLVSSAVDPIQFPRFFIS